MFKPLTIEEKEDLVEFVRLPGLAPFLAELERLVVEQENDVIKYTLGEEKELLHRKLRSEGARKLFNAINHRVESIKKPKKAI